MNLNNITYTITIHWVHSHDKSICNNTIDGYAKIAANIVQFLDNNNGIYKIDM